MSLALSLPLAAFATGIPAFPMNFYGDVTIATATTTVAAPAGSVIKAYDGSVSDDNLLAQFTLTTAGVYGDSDRTKAESAKLSIPEYTSGLLIFGINSPQYDNNDQLADTETYTGAGIYPDGSFQEFVNITQNLAFTGATLNSAVTSIAVTPASASIVAGSAQQFTATATYFETGAATKDITLSCDWTSSSAGAATIGINNGLATGVAAGSTTITASYPDPTYGAKIDTASLTVTAVAVGGGGGGGGGGGYTTPTMPSTTTGKVTATRSAGGTTTFTTGANTKVTVSVPAYAVSASTKIAVAEKAITVAAVTTAATAVPSGKSIVGGYVYDITAESGGESVTEFNKDITLTFTYKTSQITGLKESTLVVNYWDEDEEEWNVLGTTVYKKSNKVKAKTKHFTYFAIIGEEGEEVVTPITEMTIAEIKAKIAEILAQIKVLQAELNKLLGVSVEGCAIASFDRNLKVGMSGDDVKCLQIILNSASATRVADTGVGSSGNETNYFGSLTKAGVIKFQEKYVSDILAPWNLTEGTGYVGSTTLDKLNSLLK